MGAAGLAKENHLGMPVSGRTPVIRSPMNTPASPTSSSRRILVVEDDRLLLMNIRSMLEDLGHVVIEAVSGAQALDIFTSEMPVDLVITDQSMPQMTGMQLAEKLRTIRPDLPVLVVTGYADLPPGVSVAKLGKPFFPEDLARALKQLFVENEG